MTSTNATAGFWGNKTSNVNFCESKYEVSFYFAEFWNTISNLIYIVPVIGVIYCLSRHKPVDVTFIFSFCIAVFMGCGSWMFHMTMKFRFQLWDELSMQWLILHIFYMTLVIRYGDYGARKWILPIIIYGLIVNFIYIVLDVATVFQVSFGINVWLAIGHSYWVGRDQRIRCQETDPKLGALIRDEVLAVGVVLIHVAFIIWEVDLNICSDLQKVRNSLWPVLRPATQLHAWWHILSGYAGLCLMLHTYQARLVQLKRRMKLSPILTGVEIQNLSEEDHVYENTNVLRISQ